MGACVAGGVGTGEAPSRPGGWAGPSRGRKSVAPASGRPGRAGSSPPPCRPLSGARPLRGEPEPGWEDVIPSPLPVTLRGQHRNRWGGG